MDRGVGLPAWTALCRGHSSAHFRAEVNGVIRPEWCITEALAGEMGWVVVENDHLRPSQHSCLCANWSDDPPCQRTEYGRVVLVGAGGLRVEG